MERKTNRMYVYSYNNLLSNNAGTVRSLVSIIMCF